MSQEDSKQLRRVLAKRYRNLKERSEQLGIPIPNQTDFVQQMADWIETKVGLNCHYCTGPLNLYGTAHDYKTVLSLDHRIPLTQWQRGQPGPHGIENLAVCCYRCNLAKTVMSYATFVEVVQTLRASSPMLLDRFLNECFRARLADKLERVAWEKTAARRGEAK